MEKLNAWWNSLSGFEAATIIIGAVGVVINFILFIVFAFQLFSLRGQIATMERLDRRMEERARRQATVEFYAATSERRNKFLAYARDQNLTTAAAIVEHVLENQQSELRTHLIDYLNYYEFLAAGVNMETYDLETIRRLAASRIVEIADSYRGYFEWSRTSQSRPGLWVEVQALADKLRAQPQERASTEPPEELQLAAK